MCRKFGKVWYTPRKVDCKYRGGMMARLLKSSFGIGINLDGNVGSNGGNGRSDVGTLQFAMLLLSSGQQTPMGNQGGGALSVPGQGTIAVDGYYGPQTAAYIAAYQAMRVKSPGPSGGALPTPNGNFGNFRSNGWNFGLLQRDVETTMGNFLEKVKTDTRCPPFVRQSFFE